MKRFVLLSFIFLFIGCLQSKCFAQSEKIDSLKNELKKQKQDTSRVNTLLNLAWELRKLDSEKGLAYTKEALSISKTIQFLKGEGNAFAKMGDLYFAVGKYAVAETHYNKALEIKSKIGEDKEVASCLKNIGDVNLNLGNYGNAIETYFKAISVYESIGEKKAMPYNNIAACYFYLTNYPQALNYYFKALEIAEEFKEKKQQINPLIGIGNVYRAKGENKQALKYYKQVLEISEESNNQIGVFKSLTNIGNIYKDLQEYDTALTYYSRSLVIKEKLGDKPAIAITLMNIGNIYTKIKDYKNALIYYEKALFINQEIMNKAGCASSLINIGIVYSEINQTEKAIDFHKRGLIMAELINNKEILIEAHEELSEIYFKTNDYKNAYLHHKNYATLKDSILNETTSKNMAEMQTRFETTQKEKEIESLTKDKMLQDAKIESQNNLRNAFIVGFVLLILLIILTYNRYLIKQKANVIIAEKNKEITESISYAKRIQSSFLTSEKYIAKRLNDYFIYYNPRNIVSGDFYWLMEKNNKLYICTADCTGHGIPGAFMSLISMGILNEIFYSKTHITHTDEILNELRSIIIMAVNPEGATEEARDGMDAVLYSLDFNKMELEYSSANNSFYIIRNGELLVFKPDKMPVGKHVGDEKPFTRNTVALQKGDCIYTFSDGYADQFGGPKGKKFQSKQLKELFLSHCHKPMAVQQEIYAQTLTDWKGENEQVDDILVMGIRI